MGEEVAVDTQKDGPFELVSYRLGALPLVNHFWDRIGLDALLARWLPGRDRRFRLDPAVAIRLVVVNLLVGRTPLYGLGEWATPFAPVLLGQGLGIVRVRLVGDVGVGGPGGCGAGTAPGDHVGIQAHDQTGPPCRVAPAHCCAGAPSAPGVRVIPAPGSSKPREDPLPQTPYVTLDPRPVNRPPRQGLALRSVHPRRSRGVHLVLRFPRRHTAPLHRLT